jgi:phosphatidylinositol glycan class W
MKLDFHFNNFDNLGLQSLLLFDCISLVHLSLFSRELRNRSMGYKEEKELFVSNSTGGSITRINLVCLTAIVRPFPFIIEHSTALTHAPWYPLQTSYSLWTVAHARLLSRLPPNSLAIPFLEFLILVFPLLLALTSFSAHPFRLNLLLFLLTVLWAVLPSPSAQETTPPLSPELGKKRKHERTPSQVDTRPFARPFVTSYRAIMMVMTVLGILAVDFPFFPREFAKAETWGTSLVRSRFSFTFHDRH